MDESNTYTFSSINSDRLIIAEALPIAKRHSIFYIVIEKTRLKLLDACTLPRMCICLRDCEIDTVIFVDNDGCLIIEDGCNIKTVLADRHFNVLMHKDADCLNVHVNTIIDELGNEHHSIALEEDYHFFKSFKHYIHSLL